MQTSNFAELRRVRAEMSRTAGHRPQRYIDLLSAYREKYRDRLVNHGAETEQRNTDRHATDAILREESSASSH